MRQTHWVTVVALCLTGAASPGRAEDAFRVGSVWEGSNNFTYVDKGKTQQGGGEWRLEVNSRNGKNFSATLYLSNNKSLIVRGTLAEGGEVACRAPDEVDNLKQHQKDWLDNLRVT